MSNESEPEQAPSTAPQTSLRFEVKLYPNPILRRPAEPIEAFDDGLRKTVADMFERMAASRGVGLAAPQVGLRQRIMVINPSGEPGDELALVNPTITDKSGPITTFEEGCLSFPDIYAEVDRPDECTVTAFTPDGEAFEQSFSGFPSRVIQHEYDHLEGVLLVDRMSPADKQRHKAALNELVDRFKRAQANARPARK